MPTVAHKSRKHRGQVSAGHGRVGRARKHPGGHGNAGGLTHHRTLFDRYHPHYFGKLGMRHLHMLKNRDFCPTVNIEKLLTLVPEEVREKALAGTPENALVLDVTQHGAFKVLGKGNLPCPLIVRARFFSQQAEQKILAAGGRCEIL
ncbi:Ribosomal protein L18e/L15 [Carpediemonas membranifera]|uniref:Ribosomal protein L18e/L15 n=1 Tax=Carpediemonas membranifera TaxID=201153 RepID=A0A8J6E1E5_9EUKA|nr:Ribosomal protein L18e/L15 [Carpediemonas membranifera]|eukprot:KAG9396249.1 Ribosomal protein L18e/L15 [Carpediemonas membranifera]